MAQWTSKSGQFGLGRHIAPAFSAEFGSIKPRAGQAFSITLLRSRLIDQHAPGSLGLGSIGDIPRFCVGFIGHVSKSNDVIFDTGLPILYFNEFERLRMIITELVPFIDWYVKAFVFLIDAF